MKLPIVVIIVIGCSSAVVANISSRTHETSPNRISVGKKLYNYLAQQVVLLLNVSCKIDH